MPSVRGSRSQRQRLVGAAAYLLALLGGAMVLALLLHAVTMFSKAPMVVVGVVGVLCVILGGAIDQWHERHTWLIPKRWARFGHIAFAGSFGGVQGLGFLTPISSGFWVLVSWTLAAEQLEAALVPFGVYAAARATPMFLALIKSHDYGPARMSGGLQATSQILSPFERSFIAVTVVVLLLSLLS